MEPLDEFTNKHLNAWLDHTVRDEDREHVKALMVHEYNSDPEIYDRLGWPIVYRNIEDLICRKDHK